MSKPSIMIDAGHGGEDPGALGPRGLREKDVALEVALRLGELLLPYMDVFYTRKTDIFIPLGKRAQMANEMGVDAFLSIHCNSAANPADGFEVFTTPGLTISDPLATEIFKSVAEAFPTRRKRLDTADGDPDKEANFAVLRLTHMASALMELEFIHTEAGESFLGDDRNQRAYANALGAGVLKHFKLGGAAPVEPSTAAWDEVKRLSGLLAALAIKEGAR